MREIEFFAGPYDGQRRQIPGLDGMDWPAFMCTRASKLETWQHYIRSGRREGLYVYGGECAGLDHQGADPHDHDGEQAT